MVVTALGAVAALVISIFLIIKKVPPAYGLIGGALLGGIVGGAGVTETVEVMMSGAKNMIPAILRVLSAGILAGILIQSGAATKIADTIIEKMGSKRALLAIAIATLSLTAVGVFGDVSIITIAPIALAIAKKTDISKAAILVALVGGGKAGNVMSPNPNAIAASENMGVPLTSVMMAGIIPAIVGVLFTYIIAKRLSDRGKAVKVEENESIELAITQNQISATSQESVQVIEDEKILPTFFASIVGPLTAISLLLLKPIIGIAIDPLIALPIGGLVGLAIMGELRKTKTYIAYGLEKMSSLAIVLIGTGTLAGIISNSALKDVIISGINIFGLPSFALAPISGILMSAATASTTSGTAVATSVFGGVITSLGVSSIATAAMIHAGAVVLDHLPHGSVFHASGNSLSMKMKERLKLVPYEALVGLSISITSAIMFGFIIK